MEVWVSPITEPPPLELSSLRPSMLSLQWFFKCSLGSPTPYWFQSQLLLVGFCLRFLCICLSVSPTLGQWFALYLTSLIELTKNS